MQSITRNRLTEYGGGRLLRRPSLPDEKELLFSFVERLPRSTPARERIGGDALAVLSVLVHSRDSDAWTVPTSRAELARLFQHQWPDGRTFRLLDELSRRGFLEAREYVVHERGGWRTWTRFRVRARSEHEAGAIPRRRRHR